MTDTTTQRLDPAEVNYVFVDGPEGAESWTVHEWNAYLEELAATGAGPAFRVTGSTPRSLGFPTPRPQDADTFASLTLSPAAQRAAGFLRAWNTAPMAGRGSRHVISRPGSASPDKDHPLLAGDVRELIHDQGKVHEFWAESERQKRIIAALVEIIDGDQAEAVADLPTVAASSRSIQRLIDARAKHDAALKEARSIASEVPGDCLGEGCTVVDGKCLDCGQVAR